MIIHDVDEDSAPMHVIPGSHLQAFDILPRVAGQMNDIRQISQFAKPVLLKQEVYFSTLHI